MNACATPVFITARFRTGSTMLWHLLRQVEGLTTYYEPCHDNLIAHVLGDTPVQDSHRGVVSYWDEYRPLLDRLTSVHSNDFGICRLLLEAPDDWLEFERYLRFLIDSSAPRRPVLQFNRVDFRLPWLKTRFPEAVIVHLFRNPREQWLSMTRHVPDDRRADPDENTDYDLAAWTVSLSAAFPFLAGPHIRHSYERHYLIWKLSSLMGTRTATVSLDYDRDFVARPQLGVAKLLDAIDAPRDMVSRLAQDVRPAAGTRRAGAPSDDGFAAMEESCDRLLGRLGLSEQFGLVPLAEIRRDHAAEWDPFVEPAHAEAVRLASRMFSRLRSHYLETVTMMRALEQNARNVQAELAAKEGLLDALGLGGR